VTSTSPLRNERWPKGGCYLSDAFLSPLCLPASGQALKPCVCRSVRVRDRAGEDAAP
jgi:hypothetical protein